MQNNGFSGVDAHGMPTAPFSTEDSVGRAFRNTAVDTVIHQIVYNVRPSQPPRGGKTTWLHCSWLSCLAERRTSRTKPPKLTSLPAKEKPLPGPRPSRHSPRFLPQTRTRLGNEPTAIPTAEGLVNADSGGEADSAEASPTENAEARSRSAFFGRSGHLAVMSEFLHRRINVAIPEVDVGDDVFVVKGSDDTVTRVQVKSATARAQANSHFAPLTCHWHNCQYPGTRLPWSTSSSPASRIDGQTSS